MLNMFYTGIFSENLGLYSGKYFIYISSVA
jgi:hypothetical protein